MKKVPINALLLYMINGAYIGDLFMSLIHTCNLQDVNPFEYLTAMQQHSFDIFQNPENWLPWNFENAVERKKQQIVDNPRIIG
jgi:hypothetical protein